MRGDMTHKKIANHALEITVSQSATSDCCGTTQRVAHGRNIQKGSIKNQSARKMLLYLIWQCEIL